MLERELFALLEHTTDAAFVLSEEGKIQFWNKAAQTILGYPSSELLHKTCYEVLHGIGPLGTRVCHEGCSVMECAGKNHEIPDFDMSVKTRSGQRLWINMSTINMSTIVWDNPRTGGRLLIHLAHDITEQKKDRGTRTQTAVTNGWNELHWHVLENWRLPNREQNLSIHGSGKFIYGNPDWRVSRICFPHPANLAQFLLCETAPHGTIFLGDVFGLDHPKWQPIVKEGAGFLNDRREGLRCCLNPRR